MYKKILALMMALAVMFAFTGCMSSDNEITVNADGTVDTVMVTQIDKEAYEKGWCEFVYEMTLEQLANDKKLTAEEKEAKAQEAVDQFMKGYSASLEAQGLKPEVINGKEYFVSDESESGATLAEARAEFRENYDSKAWLSLTGFKMNTEEIKDMVDLFSFDENAGDAITFTFKMTLPYEIVKTNGNLSEDKMTVSWDFETVMSKATLYAFAADKTKPSVTGVKNGKSYRGKVTVKVSDKDSGVKSAVIKNTKTGKTYAKFTGSKKVTKKGKYSVTVTDNMGNKKTVKFTVK